MTYLEICQKQLPIDEGTSSTPYKDSVGVLTIGVGRNLEKGLADDEIALLLKNDIAEADKAARAVYPAFDSLTEARKAVLVNMAFNLGQARLAGFVHMLQAISHGQFDRVANEMMNSRWAVQVGQRAIRLAKMMRDG